MQRRTFLLFTVIGAVSGAAGCGRRHDPRAKTLETPDFLAHVCDAATIRQLGDAYRAKTPAESSQEKLIELLTPGVSAKKIQADYANGNIVTLKGWVISLTEARQCALYSLDSQ